MEGIASLMSDAVAVEGTKGHGKSHTTSAGYHMLQALRHGPYNNSLKPFMPIWVSKALRLDLTACQCCSALPVPVQNTRRWCPAAR